MSGSTIAVEPSLFASLDPLRLAGSRCQSCGCVVFPVQEGCPRDGGEMTVVELPAAGTLWTWTVQAFEPKAPYRPPAGGFAPYAVGYVDLGDVIVEGRLEVPADQLAIGMPLQLTSLPLWDDDGATVISYAFASTGGDR
jgi:uncharacterized protein